MTRQYRDPMGRRGVLALAAGLGVTALPAARAVAQSAGNGGPVAPIRRLNDALLAVMKQGQQTPFAQRYGLLEPVIDQSFDLRQILAESIGLSWSSLPEQQKTELLAAFRRYTVSSYAANFNSFSGQRFEIVPTTRTLGNGEAIVDTRIVPVNGSPNTLDYVMRGTGNAWRVVDVLADGSISRVAVQRSDFRHLLNNGGPSALVAGLQQKVANLSGGMLA